MATNNSGDEAVSGGLLVVLGIIVAVVAGIFIYNYTGRDSSDVTIRAELPASVVPGRTGTTNQ